MMKKSCLICSKEFATKQARKKTCGSNSCKAKLYYQKNRAAQIARGKAAYWDWKKNDYEKLRAVNSKASKKYKVSNPESVKDYNRKYQMRTKQSVKRHFDMYFGGLRDKVIELYERKCAMCNAEDIVVHHINGKKSDNRIENLIVLCRSCHPKVHNKHWVDEGIVRPYVRT